MTIREGILIDLMCRIGALRIQAAELRSMTESAAIAKHFTEMDEEDMTQAYVDLGKALDTLRFPILQL